MIFNLQLQNLYINIYYNLALHVDFMKHSSIGDLTRPSSHVTPDIIIIIPGRIYFESKVLNKTRMRYEYRIFIAYFDENTH